ncbi:MAG: hypothetical protein LUD84_02645 [Clostridiales bacterium]|nr:hypothetical protein [Clostridiales bacterium]
MKKLLALIMALAMILSLAACSSSSSSSDDTTTDSSTATEEEEETVSNGGTTVTIICGYGTGGTADAVARKYAQVANTIQSDYNFIVTNVTGGDGFSAATQFADEDADTMDLLVYGYGLAYRADLGTTYGTEEVDFDRANFTAVGSIDDRTWILYTTPDQSLESILEKAQTEGIKMSGGNPLSDPHLALGSLLAQMGGSVTVVSGYDGGAEQKKGLTDGEVDVFVGSTQAAQDEVEAGTLIPILAFSDTEFTGFVDENGDAITVPTVAGDTKAAELDADTDFSSSILPGGGMLAAHTGCDEDFYNDMIEITENVWAEADYYEWIDSVLLNNFQIYGEEAVTFMDEACVKALNAYDILSAE